MSFRNTIMREVERRGLNGCELAKLVAPRISTRMVQAYLSGDSDMTGERLSVLCAALGLELHEAGRNRGGQ
jgi:ribosome-binding protein aMBF1 (putative translation factor)